VRASHFQKIAPLLQEKRYCFDIELTHHLLHKAQASFYCEPVSWDESPGSRLGPSSVLRMFFSTLRLKFRLG
jgi:hypothetical protein